MTLEELTQDTRALQGVLKADGLYTGRIDGIHGPKTAAALAQLKAGTAELRKQYLLDSRSEANLATCGLKLQRIVRRWMVQKVLPWAKTNGIHAVRIIQGTRSNAEQAGLSRAVTSADAGRSYHNYGCAIDLGIFGTSDRDYETGSAPYKRLHDACGTPDGLIWGGVWRNADLPHYQIGTWGSTISPLISYLNR